MSGEMIKFEDAVKARLKDIVADLIPEERWVMLVKQTVAEFEQKELPALVKKELTERYTAEIRREFAKPEWMPHWDNSGRQGASEMTKKLIIESAPLVLAGLIGGAVQQTVCQMQNSMPRY